MIGRWLKEGEVVHHINSVRHDNREENLMVFNSQKDHRRYYSHYDCYIFYQNNESVWFSEIKEEYKNDKNYKKKCRECGKLITENSELCTECSRKPYYRCEHPSRETLKELIRNKTFTDIGRMYGVTDNTIRKWCDKYNLPRKKSIIKTIPD